ncbi:MAG: winged helix-turn-helix transcriptional regulator [Candidatus Micrarchaeota archaeon]
MVEITKIKLDKADRIILAELDRNCRVPTSRLAKLARKSRQSVEYRIRRLVGDGIITGFNVAINPHKMGYKLYKFYLQLRNVPEERKRLLTYLRTSGIVYWMGECDGVWDLIFEVFAKSDYEFYGLKNELISEFGDIIVSSYWDLLIDVKQYPKMYFTNEVAEPVIFAGEIVHNEMDSLDHAILAEMVNNARIPLTELAVKVKSTSTRVSNRLRRMEKLGIIIQYRIGVDLNKLGLEMYKAIFHIEKYTKNDEKKLLTYMSFIPNIQYFIRNAWNIEPELVVSNYHEYYEIINKVKMEFPHVIRNVESVLMKTDEWTPGYRNLLKAKI